MYLKTTLAVILACLLSVSVFAGNGKDFNSSQAASYCGTCEYKISDDTTALGSEGFSYSETEHLLTFSAPDKSVSNIEVSFFVPVVGARQWSRTILFTDYLSLIEDSLSTDSGVWFYYQWVRTGDYDSLDVPTELMSFVLRGTECAEPSTGTELIFQDNAAEGFKNSFAEATLGNTTPAFSNGHRFFYDPVADLTAWPTGASSNTVVDSAVVGGQVAVPLYFRDITFNYYTSYGFVVGYDTAYLDFDHFEYNYEYSFWANVTESADGVHISKNAPLVYPVPAQDVVFGILYFNIENDATIGNEYQVWVRDGGIFNGCEFYADTTDTESEKALVKVADDHATWKIQVRDLCNTAPPGEFTLDFYVRTNQYLATNSGSGTINAALSIDTSALVNIEFRGVDRVAYGGDSIRWQIGLDGNYVTIQEHPTQSSPQIVPSTSFQLVGKLRFYVPATNGTYNVTIDSDASRTYVRTSITDQLLTVANGKLDTQNGYIKVKSCTNPGCPAVFSWNGSDFAMEDFVLTHSQRQSIPQAEADYLPLKTDLATIDGQYSIQIREFENEKTYLDQVELIAVDYPIGSQIGISETGEILTHQQWIEPISAVDRDGNDVLSLIGAEDGVRYVVDGEGSLKLTFANPYAGKGASRLGFLATGESKPDPRDPAAGLGSSYVNETNWRGVTAEIQAADGKWFYLGEGPVRESGFDGSNWVFDDPSVEFGNEINIRISWVDGFNADVQRLLVDDGSNVVQHEIAPTVAEHSALGKSVGPVANSDQQVVTLEPGETIDLRFAALGEPAAGMTRSYFLKTYGYYVSANNLPTDFALNQNYPNPFNPTTTISFDLPKAADVTLAVYNLLGQEIITLVDEHMEAGTHEVVWPGTDRDGNSVASGVYFYRLSAGEYTASKKMTLVK